MKNSYLFLLCALLLISIEFSFAKAPLVIPITVSDGYIRATIPGTDISSAYLNIINNGEKTVTFIGASSNIASRIEIHQHSMHDGMMRMRQLDSVIIDAKSHLVLQPSGLHLMLFDVEKPLQPKQIVELTLLFSNNQSINVSLPVYSPDQAKEVQEKHALDSVLEHHH